MTRKKLTRPKRQLTVAELAQRRSAQKKAVEAARGHQTGPRTPEGKAATSRNAWKTGRYSAIHRAQFGLGAASLSKLYGKPCVTTCPFHPDNRNRTEAPCSLVLDGLTHAGGDCLDKSVYVNALSGLMDAMQNGEFEQLNTQIAVEQAANFELLQQIRSAIAEHGVLAAIPMVNKDGELILDEQGNTVVGKFQLNPAIAALAQLVETMKINMPELLLTPKARAGAKDDDQKTGLMQELLGGLFNRVNGAKVGKALPRGRDE